MVEEFFYVTQWANAYMYIMSSMYMPMYVASLNKDCFIIIITVFHPPHSQTCSVVVSCASLTSRMYTFKHR